MSERVKIMRPLRMAIPAWVWLGFVAVRTLPGDSLPNAVKLYELTGAGQPARPVTISRVFARGEIAHYAKPRVNGQVPAAWQCDVKTRWRDGRASCQITNASNEAPIVIECPNHGFQSGDVVKITGVQGNTAANGTWKITRLTPNKFLLQGSAGNGTYTGGGVATGPGPGSLRHAIISFKVDLPPNGQVTVDFVDDPNPCSLGSAETCLAAALDQSAMLAQSWGAVMEVTQGVTKQVSARTMLGQGHFRYWLRGPVVTTVIAEDRSPERVYDFGWRCTANCSGDYSTATWTEDTEHRSLHPIFVLTFYAGWPGVRLEYILENVWVTHLQDQHYNLALRSGSNGNQLRYSKTDVTHYARTRWRKVFWDGEEPQPIRIDHNLPYLTATGAVPNYDLQLTVDADEIQRELSSYSPAACDISGSCNWTKYFPTSGGRAEIGLVPRWEVVYLYTGDPNLWRKVWDNANVSGHIPIHYRESHVGTSPTRYFLDLDGDGTSKNDPDDAREGNTAFGRIVSVEARPAWSSGNLSSGADATPPVATLSSSHGWTVDLAHQPLFGYIAYLLSGEWYFLEELQFWSAFNIALSDPCLDYSFCRHGSYGIVSQEQQTRGVAWATRTISHGVFASPDDQLEKQYLLGKLEATLQAWEGRQQILRGDYYNPLVNAPPDNPCPVTTGSYEGRSYSAYNHYGAERREVTPYCFGWRRITDPNKRGFNPLGFLNDNDAYVSVETAETSSSYASRVDSPWQYSFVHAVVGRMGELGFAVDALIRRFGRLPLSVGGHPDHNRYLCCTYRIPVWDLQQEHPKTPRQHLQLYRPEVRVKAGWSSGDQSALCDPSDGYPHYFVGALTFFKGLAYGPARFEDVYSWFSQQNNVPNIQSKLVGCQGSLVDPKWALRPRYAPSRITSVTAGTNAVILGYTASSGAACTITLDDSPSFDSPVAVQVDGGGGPARQFVATGLQPDTTYYYRLACPEDPWQAREGSFRTLNVSGVVQFRITLRPAGIGIEQASLEYGASPSLGSETARVDCAAGCSFSLQAPKGQPFYYRVKYWRSGAVASVGNVLAAIP